MYYLQSRYYDPQIGRFINADEIIYTDQGFLGFNTFAYCRNNPVCREDVSGLTDASSIDDEDDKNYFPDKDLGQAGGNAQNGSGSSHASSAAKTGVGGVQSAGSGAKSSLIPIYRYHATRNSNLWPRQGIDFDGLSFSLRKPRLGIGYVQTTMEQVISSGSLKAMVDHGSHVLVVPVNGTVSEWMNEGAASIFTEALSELVEVYG